MIPYESDADAEALVTLASVSVRYGGRLALVDLSLAVPARNILSLLARNGAGKTTVIRMVAGLSRTSSGELRWPGHPLEY